MVCHEKIEFTEEQIAFALRQAESGTTVAEVCRKMGVSEATFYNWKKKYGGLGVSELRRLKQLEEENARLKRMVADLSLDKQMLQEVIQKAVRPARKRELANFLIDAYRVSIRRATAVIQLRQATYFYRPHPRDDRTERQRIRRDRRHPHSLWRAPHPRPTAARRLADQSQENLPDLLRGRFESAAQAQTASGSRASPHSAGCLQFECVLEHGFRRRSVVQRPENPGLNCEGYA
ncbi:Transposase [Chromobacterium vaccinii]|nr:Transposase [Chromobacterium vaccinii]